MKELLEKYKDILPNLFLELYNDFKGNYIAEYEFLKESQSGLRAMTRSNEFDEDFCLFFRNTVGSLFGFWILDKNDFSKNPIVQFSRDGAFGVLASNFNLFLSQLHFLGADAWQLSNYMSHLEFPINSDDEGYYILTNKEVEEHIDSIRNDFEGTNTIEWLINHKIPKIDIEDLFPTILNSFEKSPNVQDFLDK